MQQAYPAGKAADNLQRIGSSALDPVNVQLKAQLIGIFAYDVQQELAFEALELDVMVVIVQLYALIGQLLRGDVGHAAEVQHFVQRRHTAKRQHAYAHKVAIKRLAVGHNLIKVSGDGLLRHGAVGRYACGYGGDFYAEIVLSAAHCVHVRGIHGYLRNFHAAIAYLVHLFKRIICAQLVEFALEHHRLNANIYLRPNALP